MAISLNDRGKEKSMNVKVSSKYQVVIPEEVRQAAHIKAGQEVEVMALGDQVVIVPVRPITSMKGAIKDLPREGYRDRKDRA
jgi:AbrB family looped-hinge helix DNA binding protein